jgi:hypothetical protein
MQQLLTGQTPYHYPYLPTPTSPSTGHSAEDVLRCRPITSC